MFELFKTNQKLYNLHQFIFILHFHSIFQIPINVTPTNYSKYFKTSNVLTTKNWCIIIYFFLYIYSLVIFFQFALYQNSCKNFMWQNYIWKYKVQITFSLSILVVKDLQRVRFYQVHQPTQFYKRATYESWVGSEMPYFKNISLNLQLKKYLVKTSKQTRTIRRHPVIIRRRLLVVDNTDHKSFFLKKCKRTG